MLGTTKVKKQLKKDTNMNKSLSLIVGIALSIAFISSGALPPSTRDLFDRVLPALFAETMSMAVVFLGPGAFSIDAYLYGRKEIIIPYRSRE